MGSRFTESSYKGNYKLSDWFIISFTSDVKLMIEYFEFLTMDAIFYCFCWEDSSSEINGSFFSFDPDCQYTLRFFKFIFLSSFSVLPSASLSTKVGFHSLSVVMKLIYSRVTPHAYFWLFLFSSNRTWKLIILSCKLSMIFLPSFAIVPSYFLSSFSLSFLRYSSNISRMYFSISSRLSCIIFSAEISCCLSLSDRN